MKPKYEYRLLLENEWTNCCEDEDPLYWVYDRVSNDRVGAVDRDGRWWITTNPDIPSRSFPTRHQAAQYLLDESRKSVKCHS